MIAWCCLLILLCQPISAKLVAYSFVVEEVPGNPDGFPRPVIGVYEEGTAAWVADRPFPGPVIRAQNGDTLSIKVKNLYGTRKITVHYHGLHMQNNPWMDGVNGITECGILPGETFTYLFAVNQTGTYWYHSHATAQYGDGLLGPIVIDYADGDADPVKAQFPYTQDYTLMLQEWYHETTNELVLLYTGPVGSYKGFSPSYPYPPPSILINGRGQFNCTWNYCDSVQNNVSQCEQPQCMVSRRPFLAACQVSPYPPDEFSCQGEYVRLRLINGGHEIPIKVWIDRHNLTVVAKDGFETKPFASDHVNIAVGQRLDVMVKCSQPAFKYRIFASVSTYMAPDYNRPDIWTYAFLTYEGATKEMDPLIWPGPDSDRLLPDSMFFEYELAPLAKTTSPPADERIYLLYEQIPLGVIPGSPLEEWAVNGTVFALPKESLLQTMFLAGGMDQAIVTFTDVANYTHSTNVVHFEYGKTYEVVLISLDDDATHPWHIHGYWLDFVAVGHFNSSNLTPISTDQCNETTYNITTSSVHGLIPDYNEPTKVVTVGDSFTVPNFGYVVFRFTADNIGPWFFHCHVEWHLEQGMAILFSVENAGSYSGINDPPNDMRVCGSRAQWQNAVVSDNSSSNSKTLWIGLGSGIGGVLVGALVMVAFFACTGKDCSKQNQYQMVDNSAFD